MIFVFAKLGRGQPLFFLFLILGLDMYKNGSEV